MRLARICAVLAVGTMPLVAAASPWADSVYSYDAGTLQESPIGSGAYFGDPGAALGPVSSAASWLTPSVDVVQLGQGGSITLGFSRPVLNNIPAPGSSNPLGCDLVVFGNSFEVGFRGSGAFYREPGFVEVAKKDAAGRPATWYLLLPDRWPASLVGGTDSGPGPIAHPAFSGYADVSPVNGAGNPMLPPDNADSAGGDGFFLENAVLESAPGVPLLEGGGQPQYVHLDWVDFVRITDAIPNDGGVTGSYTTDIDAVLALPGITPEPAGLLVPVAGVLGLLRRRVRNR